MENARTPIGRTGDHDAVGRGRRFAEGIPPDLIPPTHVIIFGSHEIYACTPISDACETEARAEIRRLAEAGCLPRRRPVVVAAVRWVTQRGRMQPYERLVFERRDDDGRSIAFAVGLEMFSEWVP
jgi:hypothetical protein